MRVSVGRIVHYVGAGRRCTAALVTHVWSETQAEKVSVTIFEADGSYWPDHEVEHDFAKHPGTWHWPERVE